MNTTFGYEEGKNTTNKLQRLRAGNTTYKKNFIGVVASNINLNKN